MSFETLGLAPALISALTDAGFSTPTPVQAAAIPQALAGHDLMVSSQTGSGKTAAFMLPALHRIAQMPANKGVGVQVLVLTPTRELALQVTEATATYGRKLADLRSATVVGGMPYGAQLKALSRRVDVLVATPGRLIDHLQSGRVKLNTVHTLVLDEADRMLDMGFIEDIETIISRLPAERQTLLFSATLDGTVAKLAARMMREPQRIEIASRKEKHSNITQSLLYADDAAHKMALLDHVLRDAALDQAIVFTSTKRGADDLAYRLTDQGFSAAALHGDMNQRQRTRTLSQLQRRQLRILVATDVAARGIDVQGISHAVNFDLPMQAEDYVHRIGRTGRAGRSGLAYTLATHAERHKVRRIEHYIGQSINAEVIAGLEPQRTPRPSSGNPRSGKPAGAKRGGNFSGPREASPRREHSSRSGPSFSDRPQREAGFRGERSFSDRPQRDSGFRGERSFSDRPQRDAGFRGERSFSDRPQREGAHRDERSFSDRPQSGFRSERSFSDRPQRDSSFRGAHAPSADAPRRDPRPFSERGPRTAGARSEQAPRHASDRASFGDRPPRKSSETGPRSKPAFNKRPGKSFANAARRG